MLGLQKLLVATDFSERAAWAEKRAAMLGDQHQCKTVELMTVVESEQFEGLAKLINKSPETARTEIADSVLQELKSKSSELVKNYGNSITCTVQFGQAAKEIAARSESMLADLIVIGAHGGNFFTDLFLGNTADKLIRRCRRPLLIVKNEPVFQYRQILIPVDFSADAKQAAQLALELEPQAMLTFLHVYDLWFVGKMHYAGVSQDAIDRYRFKASQDALLALNEFIDDLDVQQRHLTRHIVAGHPSAVVRDYAEQVQPDLIVMGKHGRTWIEELIVGSVTRDTVDWTKCDIIVVPPNRA